MAEGISGMLAELISDAVVHPIDVVKTWQQTSTAIAGRSFLGVAAHVVAQRGPTALLAGIWPFCLFNMAGGALKFQSYESVRPVHMASAHRTSSDSARRRHQLA